MRRLCEGRRAGRRAGRGSVGMRFRTVGSLGSVLRLVGSVGCLRFFVWRGTVTPLAFPISGRGSGSFAGLFAELLKNMK